MAKVEIIITQSPHGSSVAGEAKRDLDLYATNTENVYFTNSTAGNVGVTTWLWTLIERPPGSVVTIQGATSSQAYIQPDVYGRYVVSLRINGLGNDTPGYGVTVAGVSFPSLGTAAWGDELGDWDLPAFYEGTYANWTDYFGSQNPYGAQRELYRILYHLRSHYLPLITGAATSDPLQFTLPGSLVQRTDIPSTTAWADAAMIRGIDMSDYEYTNVYFAVLFLREGTAGTAKARLYDVTNAEVITSSELTTTSTTVVQSQSSALTVGSSAGNIRNDADTIYKVQIAIDGGVTSTDYVNLYAAYIIFA